MDARIAIPTQATLSPTRRTVFDLGKLLGFAFEETAGLPAIRHSTSEALVRPASRELPTSVMIAVRPRRQTATSLTRRRLAAPGRSVTALVRSQPPAFPPLLAPWFARQSAGQRPQVRLPHRQSRVLATAEGTASIADGWSALHDNGEINVRLPFYLGRHVSPATLRMLADRPDDTLFRKLGERWEIVSDDDLIDLADSGQEYRLANVVFNS